jgi:hypothetical protein
LILIVFEVVFLVDFVATVTLMTQVPLLTATIFPALTLQYFADELGTLAVTFAPFGVLSFAIFAMLANVAGLLDVITRGNAVAGDTGMVGAVVVTGAAGDGRAARGIDVDGVVVDTGGATEEEQLMFP